MNCKMNRHISQLAAFLAIGAVILLGSCSSETDMPDMPDKAQCIMEFYVNVGSGAKKQDDSRAASPLGDRFKDGNAFENFIDIEHNDFRVYLFSTGNKLIRALNPANVTEVTENEFEFDQVSDGSPVYRVRFRVDKILEEADKTPQSFKVVMLANWGTYPTVAAGADMSALTGDVAGAVGDFNPDPDKIPFFGVQEYNGIIFTPGDKTTYQEDMQLLRAFAKIEVWDDAATLAEIKSVKLTRYNSKFHKAPVGVYHNNDYTKYEYDNDFVTTPSIPAGSVEKEDGIIINKNDAGHFAIYVPEYKNIGRTDPEGTDNRARLIVDYENGKEYIIEFQYYQEPPEGKKVGDPFDIRRNYWYQFVVKRNTADIEVVADVLPYHVIELDPIFGLDRD